MIISVYDDPNVLYDDDKINYDGGVLLIKIVVVLYRLNRITIVEQVNYTFQLTRLPRKFPVYSDMKNAKFILIAEPKAQPIQSQSYVPSS